MFCVAVCDSNFFEMFMSENYQQSDKLELVLFKPLNKRGFICTVISCSAIEI